MLVLPTRRATSGVVGPVRACAQEKPGSGWQAMPSAQAGVATAQTRAQRIQARGQVRAMFQGRLRPGDGALKEVLRHPRIELVWVQLLELLASVSERLDAGVNRCMNDELQAFGMLALALLNESCLVVRCAASSFVACTLWGGWSWFKPSARRRGLLGRPAWASVLPLPGVRPVRARAGPLSVSARLPPRGGAQYGS